jgi:pimeloyl-ACP methyl ester carboxylesterase
MSQIRTLVLVHSPLVGPGTWRALAPLLEARGYQVLVPDLRGALRATPPLYFRIGRLIAEAIDGTPGQGEIALIVHSGTGALVPMLTRGNKRVLRAIFVDALLPHPGKRWFDTAPPELALHLRSQIKGGNLPRWHRWWPRGALEAILPDEAARATFIAELHEVPVAYLEEVAPFGDIPDRAACAYLQLSAACKAEADEAERRGWPVRRLDLNHLAMLTHAAEVEAALIALLAAKTG